MKKLILIIAFIVISISVFCQDTETVYAAQVGTWSKVKNNWVWDDVENVNLIITFDKSVVSINNDMGSVFETLEIFDKKDGHITWKSLDEEYITCYLTMQYTDEYTVLIVTYNNVCFRYYY
jgi:hypothetical protein